jgi:hypothetical protein
MTIRNPEHGLSRACYKTIPGFSRKKQNVARMLQPRLELDPPEYKSDVLPLTTCVFDKA